MALFVRAARRMAGVVLVVDDDVTLAESLRSVLTDRDVVIDAAVDADGACALLDQRRYCGLVLDLVLEGSSGFDVLRHIQQSANDVPTIVVTEKLPAYVREMLAEEQVKLVFPKPVDPRVLGAVVMGMCGIPS